jgi:hypothetical protein
VRNESGGGREGREGRGRGRGGEGRGRAVPEPFRLGLRWVWDLGGLDPGALLVAVDT